MYLIEEIDIGSQFISTFGSIAHSYISAQHALALKITGIWRAIFKKYVSLQNTNLTNKIIYANAHKGHCYQILDL